jgi:hypothetical protein
VGWGSACSNKSKPRQMRNAEAQVTGDVARAGAAAATPNYSRGNRGTEPSWRVPQGAAPRPHRPADAVVIANSRRFMRQRPHEELILCPWRSSDVALLQREASCGRSPSFLLLSLFSAAQRRGVWGSPLNPTLLGAALRSNGDIEAVRWRHRHGQEYWSDRRIDGASRDDTDVSSLNGAIRLTGPEIVRPDPRRRRGWIDPPPAQ